MTGPASAININLCSFDFSGKIMKDSLIASSNVFEVDGSVAMTGVFNQSNSTDATSLSAASIVTLGGIAVTKKAFIGDDMVIGLLQTIT